MTRIKINVVDEDERIFVQFATRGYIFDGTDEAWKEDYDKILEAIETIKKVCEPE